MDEFNPSVFFIRKFTENVFIKNENRHYRKIAFQGMSEAGIVLQSKISSEPENIDSLHEWTFFESINKTNRALFDKVFETARLF